MSGDSPQSEAQAPTRRPFFEHHMWWMLVLGLCGLATYPIFKYEAFPTASLDLKKPRLEIQTDAEKLTPQLGYANGGLGENRSQDSVKGTDLSSGVGAKGTDGADLIERLELTEMRNFLSIAIALSCLQKM